MANIEKYVCDLCKETATKIAKTIPVRFTSNQTDGYPCEPYLELHKSDLCDVCYTRIIEGQPLSAHGAMGNNTYKWAQGEK